MQYQRSNVRFGQAICIGVGRMEWSVNSSAASSWTDTFHALTRALGHKQCTFRRAQSYTDDCISFPSLPSVASCKNVGMMCLGARCLQCW